MIGLDIGAGRAPSPEGFLRLDANPDTNPDFVSQAHPLSAQVHDYAKSVGWFDQLRAIDILEHLPYRQTRDALAEWLGITKHGGELFVQVPDAELIMMLYTANVDLPDGRRMYTKDLLERIPTDLPQTIWMGTMWRLLGGQNDGDIVKPGEDWRLNLHVSLFSMESLCADLEAVGWHVTDAKVNAHPNLQVTCRRD